MGRTNLSPQTRREIRDGMDGERRKPLGGVARRPVLLSFWGSFHINGNGYPRLNNGPHRRKYIHRVVVEEFWKAHGGHPVYGFQIPKGLTVNHQNGNKLDWSIGNLLVVDRPINSWLKAVNQKRHPNGVFAEEEMPEWVTENTDND